MKLFIAKVVANSHIDKNGSVQIDIPSLYEKINPSLLPWAFPVHNLFGGKGTQGLSAIPELNSFVWVFFEDEVQKKNPFYIGNVNYDDLNPHKLFQDNIKTVVGAEGVYPNVKYLYAPNGICIAITTSPNTPEITVYHPKAYLFIDKNGYAYYKDTYDNRIKIDNTGVRIKDTKNNEIKTDGTKIVINNNFSVSQ